jgi:hypothetical protein
MELDDDPDLRPEVPMELIDDEYYQKFIGPNPKDQALAFLAANHGRGLVLFSQDVKPMSGSKQYVVGPRKFCYRHLRSGVDNNQPRCFYEEVPHGKPVKVFGDIDWPLAPHERMSKAQWYDAARGKADEFIWAVQDGLVGLGLVSPGVPMPAIVLSSYQVDKVSVHIIFPTVVLPDLETLHDVMGALPSLPERTDMRPYERSGAFRTIWSIKKGKPASSKLDYMEGRGYIQPADDEVLFLDTLITAAEGGSVVNITSLIFDRIVQMAAARRRRRSTKHALPAVLPSAGGPSDAVTQLPSGSSSGGVHDAPLYSYASKEPMAEAVAMVLQALLALPPQHCEDYREWRRILASVRDLMMGVPAEEAEQLRAHLHEWSRRSAKYNAAVLDQKISDDSMDQVSIERLFAEAGMASPFQRVMRTDAMFNLQRWGQQHLMHARYLPDDLGAQVSESRLLAIKARPGCGKTSFVRSMLQGPWVQQPVLAVTVRRKQADDMSASLGLANYQDWSMAEEGAAEYVIPEGRLVVQMESLMRVDPTRMQDGILVLDEVHAGLAHFTSSTLNGKRRAVFGRLAKLLPRTKQVVLLDADLMDYDINFVRRQMGLEARM